MQKVSQAYKNSMRSSLRERAYIMVSFGLVNQAAQTNSSIDSSVDCTGYSNSSNLFKDKTDDVIYATLEENMTPVDGSVIFLPRETNSHVYRDTGLIGESLVSDSDYELIINFNMAAIDFKGMTINFGENYPVDFDMISSSGQTVEIRDNADSIFATEEVLNNTTYVKLKFYEMKNPQSRLRVYSIKFGYGLVYYNDSVISSSLESYISPIGADVPQVDFTVLLKNYDKYFNVDNPNSAINFLETGQEMEIFYGYQLPDSEDIEWIRGNHLLCSEWESDDYTATIKCQDVFRNMESEYYKGTCDTDGISYYALAEEILIDAGCNDYYIEPRLKTLFTYNPMPRVPHKQALQIIANACRAVLSQTRSGLIQIKSSFIPDYTVSANEEAPYSNVENITSDSSKKEYGTFSANYTTTDGSMVFLPRNTTQYLSTTGFVSEELSDEYGEFSTNPIVTITQEAICSYYGIRLIFGDSLPAGITFRTYNDETLVTEYVADEEIVKNLVILHDFDDFDVMEIEFTKTQEPYSRIVLNGFDFGDITNFTMTREDMTSSPKVIKQELVKEVIVPYYSYQQNDVEESVISEEVTVSDGDVVTFYLSEPSYGFSATLDDSTTGVFISSWGNYYVTLTFSVSGTFRLNVLGHRYRIVERYATNQLNTRGKMIKWGNPLLSDATMANDLAEWLGDYYSSGIEYEYSTRGNPEIDVNDIVYQENEFKDSMKVNIYRETLNFNQSFSGQVVAHRIGG